MVNEIQRVPESVTSAGHGFSYAYWPANTTIKLANVRWDSDYKDIVEFDGKSAFVNYINSLPSTTSTQLTGASYAKPFTPINLPIPFNVASSYNYLLAHNPPLYANPGDPGEYYAYFITSVEFVNPGTTRITVQLDVWQTYGYDVQFGQAYLERGHLPMHPGYIQDHKDLIKLTTPEGLDTGGEYAVRKLSGFDLGSGNMAVVMLSTVDFENSGGAVEDSGAVEARMVAAQGGSVNGLYNGSDVYYFESQLDAERVLNAFKEMPWISQGIVAIMLVPRTAGTVEGREFTIYADSREITVTRLTSYDSYTAHQITSNWMDHIASAIPSRHRDLLKLYTYPYSFIELTMYNGKPLVIKPERIKSTHLTAAEFVHITPPGPKAAVWPMFYNDSDPAIDENVDLDNLPWFYEAGEHFDFATWLDFPQTSTVNNMYLSYMASNANQISYQHQSADWSQNRVMAGAHTAAAQATKGIDTATEIAERQNQTMNKNMQTATENNMNAAYVGGIYGTVSTGPLGLVSGLNRISQADIQNNTHSLNTARNMQLNWRTTSAQNEQRAMVRDSNFKLAEVVSLGDYENEIAGINARVQDAKMIQPTISGQVGGEGFNLMAYGKFVARVKVRTVDDNVMDMLASFWRRFGYAVNRFIDLSEHGGRARLKCMTHFSYWKLKEMYLTSSRCPETFRATIRGIFEKGVTVWNSPANIGAGNNITSNQPRNLGYSGEL